MSISDKLALGLGAKLLGDNFDTKKEDKKTKNVVQTIIPKNQHQLVFALEKRNGKPVTIIGKFEVEENLKKDILKLLKSKLACGGSLKDEFIEIQGDLKDKIRIILVDNGWKFKN